MRDRPHREEDRWQHDGLSNAVSRGNAGRRGSSAARSGGPRADACGASRGGLHPHYLMTARRLRHLPGC